MYIGLIISTVATLLFLSKAFIMPLSLRDRLDRTLKNHLLVFFYVLGMMISYVEHQPERTKWTNPHAGDTFIKESGK